MQAQSRPIGRPEHQDSQPASAEVLLIAKILVRGDQQVKVGGFGLLHQFPVLQLAPAALEGGLDDGAVNGAAQRHGRALIEEDLQTASGRNGEAMARVLEHSIHLCPRHAREPLEKLADGRPAFEILEEGAHGHTRGAEQLFSADLSGHAFYGRAFTPIEHGRKVLRMGAIAKAASRARSGAGMARKSYRPRLGALHSVGRGPGARGHV